jgi:hypothetical protein
VECTVSFPAFAFSTEDAITAQINCLPVPGRFHAKARLTKLQQFSCLHLTDIQKRMLVRATIGGDVHGG